MGKRHLSTLQKTLVNWIRNHQKDGSFQTDSIIRDKALFFANSCGNARARETVTHADWLDTFKQQHNLIATGPSIGGLDSNEGNFVDQSLTCTGLMLSSTVRVPTLLLLSLHQGSLLMVLLIAYFDKTTENCWMDCPQQNAINSTEADFTSHLSRGQFDASLGIEWYTVSDRVSHMVDGYQPRNVMEQDLSHQHD